MRIALAQLDAGLGALETNAERVREAVAAARDVGADLVVFPELFLSGYALAEAKTPTALSADEARELVAAPADGPALLLGFHERAGSRTYNSAAYIERGRLVHVHRKVALVDYAPFDEGQFYAPGEELRAFTSGSARLGTLVCNDFWQPALPFVVVHDGAQVLLVPSCSSTAVPGVEASWRALTSVYARVLQCYVVFVNRVGDEGGFTFWGGSHAVDPRGEVVAEAPRLEPALVVADVDLTLVAEERERLPLLAAPRLEVVRAELDRLVRAVS